jgi:hypothetical protein
MKLHKKTRKKLYEAAAKHESLTISWPPSAPEPLPGHKYPVKGFDSETRLEVTARKEVGEKRWETTVRLDSDPVRGLRVKARRGPENPALGGPQFRAEAEPEQVDARYQRLLDEEGALKTVLGGNRNRQREELMQQEERLAEVRRRKMTKAEGRVVGRINRLRADLEEAA